MDQRITDLFYEFTEGRISHSELEQQLKQLTGNPDSRHAFAAMVEADNEELFRLVEERTKHLPDLPAQPSTVYADFMALAATIPGLAAQWEAHLQARYLGLSIEQLSDFGGFSYLDMGVFGDRVLELLTTGETTTLGRFSGRSTPCWLATTTGPTSLRPWA